MFCFNFSITTIELALISILFTSLLYPLCNPLAGAFTLKFDNKYAIFTCAVLTLFTFLLHWLATSCFLNLLSSMKYKLLPYFDLFLAFFSFFKFTHLRINWALNYECGFVSVWVCMCVFVCCFYFCVCDCFAALLLLFVFLVDETDFCVLFRVVNSCFPLLHFVFLCKYQCVSRFWFVLKMVKIWVKCFSVAFPRCEFLPVCVL